MTLANANDEELRRRLKELDEADDVKVNTFTANFIESVVYKDYATKPLTASQRSKARELLEQYGY